MALPTDIHEFLRRIGRKGGKARSERKLAAIRANQKLAVAARRKPTESHKPADQIPESEAALNE